MKTLYCTNCEKDKPLNEMRKDSSKESGYRNQCLECKRLYDTRSRQRKGLQPGWIRCPRCDKEMREQSGYQPPTIVQETHPGELWCNYCVDGAVTEEDIRRGEEKRYGVANIKAPPEQKIQIIAVKKLIENHHTEFAKILEQEKITFGITSKPKWVSA